MIELIPIFSRIIQHNQNCVINLVSKFSSFILLLIRQVQSPFWAGGSLFVSFMKLCFFWIKLSETFLHTKSESRTKGIFNSTHKIFWFLRNMKGNMLHVRWTQTQFFTCVVVSLKSVYNIGNRQSGNTHQSVLLYFAIQMFLLLSPFINQILLNI